MYTFIYVLSLVQFSLTLIKHNLVKIKLFIFTIELLMVQYLILILILSFVFKLLTIAVQYNIDITELTE